MRSRSTISVMVLASTLSGTGAPARQYTVPIPPSGGVAAVGPTTFCTGVFAITVPAGHSVVRPIRDQRDYFEIGRTDPNAVYGVSPSFTIDAKSAAPGGAPAIGAGPGQAVPATIPGLRTGYMATVKPTRFIVNGETNHAYTISRDQADRRYIVTVGTTSLSDAALRLAAATITLGSESGRGCSTAAAS